MRQVFWAGTLGRPRGIGWRGMWEGGSGWGIHVTPWLIHVNVWQNPLQYCKVISLQLIKKKKKKILLVGGRQSLGPWLGSITTEMNICRVCPCGVGSRLLWMCFSLFDGWFSPGTQGLWAKGRIRLSALGGW